METHPRWALKYLRFLAGFGDVVAALGQNGLRVLGRSWVKHRDFHWRLDTFRAILRLRAVFP